MFFRSNFILLTHICHTLSTPFSTTTHNISNLSPCHPSPTFNQQNRFNDRDRREDRDRRDRREDRHQPNDYRRSPARNRGNQGGNRPHQQQPTTGLAQHVRDLKATISDYRATVDRLSDKVDDQGKLIKRLVSMAETSFPQQWDMVAMGERSANQIDDDGLLAIVDARRRRREAAAAAAAANAAAAAAANAAAGDIGRDQVQAQGPQLPLRPQPQPQLQPLPQPQPQPQPQPLLPLPREEQPPRQPEV